MPANTPTFPVRPDNRPALRHIGYRLGAYPDVLDAMVRELNASPALSKWTHRSADDPGIALLESASVVADILTFYQEHYANEAFLRTASWRESIQELIRLTGYRLSPAIAGRATFAIEVKGTAPVIVPAEFPIKADLRDVANSVDFLTTDETTAYPHLGKFRLYRPRIISTSTVADVSSFEISAIGNKHDPDTLAAFDLKKGDKLMLVPAAPTWVTHGTSIVAQQATQVVQVSKVTRVIDRLVVEIEGKLENAWASPVTAYRINRTFRHFGHNMPPKLTYQTGSGTSMVTNQQDSYFKRHVGKSAGHTCADTPDYLYTPLPIEILALDQEVNDLSVGARIIVELTVDPSGNSSATLRKLALVRTISSLKGLTMNWGNVTGPSTWLGIGDHGLLSNNNYEDARADIRGVRIHETTSAKLTLRAITEPHTGAIASADELRYYGDAEAAATLIGRRIFIQAADGRFASASAVAVDTASPTYARMRPVTLDKIPPDFSREDFDEITPTTDVFGNLVDVTQGKSQTDVALGNGDNRQTFQTFKIPKAPLTYLLEPAATPTHVPELTIYVNSREWTRVDTFFGLGPKDEVYVVREDPKGDSYVQFGDGEMGARLPSGINNVVARYRTGTSALGPINPGAKPTAGSKLDNLDKLTLAGEVTGGAAVENAEKSRLAAPGKLQSLGRLVSIKDYESETLQIGGVVTATASWEILDGIPSIHLCVLLEQAQQNNEQFAAIEAVIRTADQARGPNRNPLRVTQCELRYIYLNLSYAHDPALITTDVDTAICATLGLVGDNEHERDGLFGLRHRRLGEKEYALRIEGTVQNIPGITWCRVDYLGALAPADDPTTLALPTTLVAPVPPAQIPCGPTELLQLHPLHLTLIPANS
jgi:hypothetical protein